MRVYLAGPMRGLPDFNFPAFDAAAKFLRTAGHEVFNPADHDRAKLAADPDVPWTVRQALRDDITWICEHAEIVVVLKGWDTSLGAKAEVATAEALGIPWVYLHEMGV